MNALNTMFYTVFGRAAQQWMAVFFLLTITIACYAQNDTTQVSQDSLPDPTEEFVEDPSLLYEKRAERRARRQSKRREAYRSRLPKNHNPRTATLLALIPGAGQIYNRRYWKVPIAVGGIGALGFFMIETRSEFECYKRALLEMTDSDPTTNYTCPRLPGADSTTLLIARNAARTSSETMILGFTLFYGLTIVDAFVDAHLARFDIDDDLSIRLEPKLRYEPFQRQWMPTLGIAVVPRISAPLNYPVSFE